MIGEQFLLNFLIFGREIICNQKTTLLEKFIFDGSPNYFSDIPRVTKFNNYCSFAICSESTFPVNVPYFNGLAQVLKNLFNLHFICH